MEKITSNIWLQIQMGLNAIKSAMPCVCSLPGQQLPTVGSGTYYYPFSHPHISSHQIARMEWNQVLKQHQHLLKIDQDAHFSSSHLTPKHERNGMISSTYQNNININIKLSFRSNQFVLNAFLSPWYLTQSTNGMGSTTQ